MFTYNIISPYVYYLISNLFSYSFDSKRRLFLFLVGTHLIVFWTFFQYQTLPDIEYYNAYYKFLTDFSIKDFYLFSPFVDTEYGYLLINKILTYISSDTRLLYFFRSLIQVFCIIFVVKKYSSNYFISIVFFFLIFGVNQSLFVVRQYLALSIFLLSINSIVEKKIAKFSLIFLISFSIHKSMIVFLPLYFFYNYIKVNNSNYKKILFSFLFFSFLFKPIITIVLNNMGLYGSYLNNDTSEGLASVGMFLRTLLFLFPLFFILKNNINDDVYLKLYFWIILFSTIISYCIIGIPSGSRLFTNYNAFNFIFVPLLISYINNKYIAFLYLLFLILVFTYLYLISSIYIYDYYFIWQNFP